MLRRQREFARGRHCAVQALQQVGWRSTESLVADAARELGPAVGGPAVGVNPDRSPVWPAGYVGSISHSRHWVCAVAAATADYRGVGLDTEVLIPAATRDLVREEVASEQEWALLQSYLPAAQAVTTLFSAKESFFKLWYPLTQQFLNFRDVELQAVAPVASARASSVAPDEPRIVLGLTHRPGNGQTLVADFHEVHARWVGDDVITLTWLPTSGPPTREPGADG
jgi:4'-phosphopantetheinyl transferase EntD